MGNPPIRPNVKSAIARLLELFLVFARARSDNERARLETQILALFEQLGATSEAPIQEARARFEELRSVAYESAPRGFARAADEWESNARQLVNARIRSYEMDGPHLTRGAREMLRIPVIEVAGLNQEFDEAQVSESLDRVLASMREPPRSRAEGEGRSRTSVAVIRAFSKNYCSIPPFCAPKTNV